MATFVFQMQCPKCNAIAPVSAEVLSPPPMASCGNCLWDYTEVVHLRVISVRELTPGEVLTPDGVVGPSA